MERVIAGFFVVPLLVSFFFGPIFVAAYPFLQIVTLLIAVPLFLVCRRLGWLSWWHSVLVGIGCAILGISINIGNPVRAEIYGPMVAVSFVGMGATGGLLFWWFALYRNERFPGVPRRVPWNMMVLIPIAVLGWFAYTKVEPFDVQGRPLVLGGPPLPGTISKSTAQILLPSGKVVTAMVLDDSPVPDAPHVCAHVVGRASFTSDTPRYWVDYFLDKPFLSDDKC